MEVTRRRGEVGMPVMVMMEGKEERRSHGAVVNAFQWFTLALWQSISRQNQRGDNDAHGKIEGDVYKYNKI